MKTVDAFRLCAATFACSLLCAAALSHPPQTVALGYDSTSKTLHVRVAHSVRDAATHYVKTLQVTVNGKAAVEQQYERQPSASDLEALFLLPNVAAGDTIEVKTLCNVAGEKSAQLTVPAESAEKETAMLKEDQLRPVGDTAPDFTLKDHTGKTVELAAFRGKKNVVLVFYPRDETPGCTKQLCTIRDDFSQFTDADSVVFGINPQGADAHSQFVEKFNFPFPLLADPEKEVVAAYGCKGLLMTQRTVYGIDKEGKIVFAQRGAPDSDEILKAFAK